MDNIVNDVQNFLMEGYREINAVLGLIIAVIAAFMLKGWGRVFIIALLATVVYAIAEVLIPVVADKAAFALPDNLMTYEYWRKLATLYVAFIVVISVFWFIKSKVLKA